MASLQASARGKKLSHTFFTFIHGERLVHTSQDAALFLEAASLVSNTKGPSSAAESLVAIKSGLETLMAAVRIDLRPRFIVASILPYMKHIIDPRVKTVGNGHFLAAILDAILVPATFWSALLQAHRDGEIQKDGLEPLKTFASLCLEIISSQSDSLNSHHADIEAIMKGSSLLNAPSVEVRVLAQRIQKVIHLRMKSVSVQHECSPGGRHDNDFSDFRDILIYPTNDEILSSEKPFLQRLEDVFETAMDDRARTYLGWLFRLLREDMLAELREDLQAAWGQTKRKRRPISFSSLTLLGGSNAGNPNPPRRHPSTSRPYLLDLHCGTELQYLVDWPEEKKTKFLDNPKAVFKHNSFGALCVGSNVIAFGNMMKNNVALGKGQFGFQVSGLVGLKNAVEALTGSQRDKIKLFVVDTPTFAYEPILRRLQDITELPLEDQLLDPKADKTAVEQLAPMKALVEGLQSALDSRKVVTLKSSFNLRLGGAQLESTINGLTSSLALIQGPPGTGKSLIGAAIVLNILKMTNRRVLVLSYTNHALEQFLEDLLDIGVNEADMVLLGPKSSPKTQSMRVDDRLSSGNFRISRQVFAEIDSLKTKAVVIDQRLADLMEQLTSGRIDGDDIIALLEFSEDDGHFWQAFQLPQADDGFQLTLKHNKRASPRELYWSWLRDMKLEALGQFAMLMSPEAQAVWNMSRDARVSLDNKWADQVRAERKQTYLELSEEAEGVQGQIRNLYAESKRKLLQQTRLIGCTTTRASMYQSIITTVDVIVVEEAGEILEAHIIAAGSPSVKQIILIGDHKQLRPKVNNYALTVEKGDGFDLNVSLFERLIKQGRPFTTLQEQHRSHPDISHFARILAYDGLKDSPKTLEREAIRGLSSRVVFVHHEHPEEEMGDHTDRHEPGSRSKRNIHEARMILKTVKYLSQQGYKTENMVVLTAYLGQLSLLKDELSAQNDPYLNDLDDHDLVRAGLMTQASSKVNKRPLRLSTIDNYQGEESDIVIASLTRSNATGDIGFLYARERLVVLMSRARNGIILFGNMNTFLKSKKGHALWQQYFDAMKEKGNIHEGLPVYCHQHPDRRATLAEPGEFDQHCPDGGCAETWECTVEDAETLRRVNRDLQMEKSRQERQTKYAQELQELDDEIYHARRSMKYETEKEDQAKSLIQKRAYLKSLRETKARADAQAAKAAQSPRPSTSQMKTSSGTNDPSGLPSEVKEEWEFMKTSDGAQNAALDQLMDLIGLEAVKEEFMSVKSSIDLKIRQGVSLSGERLSCSLLGNPGTGKTTVARLWANFLTTIGAIPGDAFKETTGAKLASNGVKGCEALIEDIKNDGGGVLFIDEAYQLSSGNSPGSKAVLDYLLAEVENLRGKVVFVLAGYNKEMESFFSHNPGLPSRFPITMTFDDYSDEELLRIFQMQLHRKFGARMAVEDGQAGLYARIVTRRIGKGRGKEGFGNARAVENAFDKILKRQAKRLRQDRKGAKPDNFFLTKADLIGAEPSQALDKCSAWTKLNQMIGLDKVKQQVKVFRDVITTNYERELAEEPTIDFTLNRVFVGSPGTGKTTIAKIYGQILSHLGLLSNGEVVVKNPSDFMGSALGQSEAQTKGILAATIGKVLVIDEAYGLYGGSSIADPYKTAVIDTIVAEVQSVPGDDRCVLLLGYRDQMENMFQNVNPGLSRRFPMSSSFEFEDFDDAAMAQILDLKLKTSGFKATAQTKGVAMDVLSQARNRPNFGNAGEVDILLNRAKENYQKRISATRGIKSVLEAVDFDQNFERSTSRDTNVAELFKEDVGREQVIKLLEGYQTRVRELKSLDMDPKEEIPFSFLFRGPPGTGKTTTARKMGQVYYDMGFLASIEVIECSATDLIGQYVGQTGPKVQQLLDKALGKVLFIDEAYRLASGGFAKEAVDELVDCVTKTKYQGKLIIILAGYVKDINNLLSINPGMSSRFPETIDFEPLAGNDCIKLLAGLLEGKKKQIAEKGKLLDISCLERPSLPFREKLLRLFGDLSTQDGWASARDVKQLSKAIFRGTSLSSDILRIDECDVEAHLRKLLDERGARMAQANLTPSTESLMEALSLDQHAPPTATDSHLATAALEEPTVEEESDDPPTPSDSTSEPFDEKHRVIRDAGVSDEVWEQLEKDKAAETQREDEYQALKESQKKARGEARERIIRQLIEEDDRRKQEEAVKAKLQALGKCPAGYQWIKQDGGYCCEAGGHWVNIEDVSKL